VQPPRLKLRGAGRRGPPPLPAGHQRSWKYLQPAELRKFKNLLFATRAIVEGAYAGRHTSPYKGASPEFVNYREYYPGDELRSIDWRAYARTDRYVVKQFQKETDLDCYLLVDKSASMGFGGAAYKAQFGAGDLSKLEYASFLAASLAYMMIKQGDKVGLTLFDRTVTSQLAPHGTFPHLHAMLHNLERTQPGETTSLGRVLKESYPMFRRRGLLVLISDMLDEPAAIFESLNMYVHRRFEIILFHVMHRYEAELPGGGSLLFVDAETRESVKCNPLDVRDAYARNLAAFVATLGGMARARGIEYNLVNTRTPHGEILEKYLLRRNNL
jgi:uncharacterized protein (DUF58 family)